MGVRYADYQMLQIDLRRFIAKNKQPAQSNRTSSNKENMPSCSEVRCAEM